MSASNPETIQLVRETVEDGRKQLQRVELRVDGCVRAALEEQRNGDLRFRFYPVGTFDWQEAQVWLQGLLELAMVGNEMEWKKDAKKKSK